MAVILTILIALTAVAATVLLCIKILPAKYDGTFKMKPLQMVHDYFNFKQLYLETVLKVLFAFFSIYCILYGLFGATIGNFITVFERLSNPYYARFAWNAFVPTFFGGLAVAVLGPIVLRLIYEGLLMFVLLVKNVIDINNKMKK